jgi:hypothetical protein
MVLDDSGDPARPSSSWRYRIDPLDGGSRITQCFTHGPGNSFLREIAETAPDRATEIIAARLDGLQANMTATLAAMKAAAESAGEAAPPGSLGGSGLVVGRITACLAADTPETTGVAGAPGGARPPRRR